MNSEQFSYVNLRSDPPSLDLTRLDKIRVRDGHLFISWNVLKDHQVLMFMPHILPFCSMHEYCRKHAEYCSMQYLVRFQEVK